MSHNQSLDVPVWGAASIGEVIGRSERAAFYLLEAGALPAKKIAGRWVSTPRKLLAAIIGDEDIAA